MKVVCIQQQASDLPDFEQTIETILAQIDKASELTPQLMVLPECSFPSYFLGWGDEVLANAMKRTGELIEHLRKKASTYNTYIAAGLVIKEDNKYFNRGILIAPDGKIAGTVNKSFMWHFDSDWFSTTPGDNIVSTPFGKWGLIICADGRMPEIVRDLALKGVDLIIDLANLTSTGKASDQLTNAQSGFMLSTRAFENNIWIVMADKVGVEANTVTYSGRSCIIAPTGEVITEASAHQQSIISADIDPLDRQKTRHYYGIDMIKARRPSTYELLTYATDDLPVSALMSKEVTPGNLVTQGATVQFFYSSKEEYLQKACFYIRTLEKQLANIIVLPETQHEIAPNEIQKLIQNSTTYVILTSDTSCRSMFAVTNSSVSSYRKVHLNTRENVHFEPGTEYRIIETPYGNLGLMLGEDGFFPESARILTLMAADCVVWINRLPPFQQEKIARTRAAENKIFVITSSQLNDYKNTNSIIVNPDGNVIASTVQGNEQATAVQIPLVLSRCKYIVPKTNAVLDRKPFEYQTLIRPDS